jgi:hypothetical protein
MKVTMIMDMTTMIMKVMIMVNIERFTGREIETVNILESEQ